MNESGYQGVDTDSWIALFAPKGTDAGIVEKLSAAMAKIVDDQQYAKAVRAADLDCIYVLPKDLTERIVLESKNCAAIVKAAGIKVQ